MLSCPHVIVGHVIGASGVVVSAASGFIFDVAGADRLYEVLRRVLSSSEVVTNMVRRSHETAIYGFSKGQRVASLSSTTDFAE